MSKISRRDILLTFASTIILATNPAKALNCDVRRSRKDGISTKSYSCKLGLGKSITATFMRVSDVLADPVNRGTLPSDYETLIAGHRLIENPTFLTFKHLFDKFSYAFETDEIIIDFNGRGKSKDVRQDLIDIQSRWRTLGVWDDPSPDVLPFFPLHDELRRATSKPHQDYEVNFLRYATANDFSDLPNKIKKYIQLWSSTKGKTIDQSSLGNLELLKFIKAWTVDGFLPLLFSNYYEDGCTGSISGGALYVPPALYVDLAVFRNDGEDTIIIDDFFGFQDDTVNLREYLISTPANSKPFGWKKLVLHPKESVVTTQRLLFGAQPYDEIQSKRAVFGETQLPKGVIVDGEKFPFDGRSHNALIVGSHYGKGSCPYLMSWCDISLEWIMLGKVIVGALGAENERLDKKRFIGLRNRFKLVEREHERTCLSHLSLELELKDGTTLNLSNLDEKVVIDIGQSYEVLFHLPPEIKSENVKGCILIISGFYEKYTNKTLLERRDMILEEA